MLRSGAQVAKNESSAGSKIGRILGGVKGNGDTRGGKGQRLIKKGGKEERTSKPNQGSHRWAFPNFEGTSSHCATLI